MRAVLALLTILVSMPSFAIEPGDDALVSADAETTRFLVPDDPTPGPSFDADSRVKVLVIEGDKARVFAGDKYGWLSVSMLADAPPPQAPSFGGGLFNGGQIQLTPPTP